MRVVSIIVGVLLVLLLSSGIGWFVFRRMMLPQAGGNLPPSGARPWSRTRVPNPDSMSGMMPDQAGQGQMPNFVAPNMGFGPGPVNFEQVSHSVMSQQNGFGSGAGMQQGFQPGSAGFNTPPQAGFGPQGMNGYGTPAAGFGGFSDSFVPPSPQIFPQSDASMIPPGSGAFPVANQGFAPASSAFNAMYGLPDDPFASSQGGAPGWMDNLGPGNGWQGNGFPTPQQPPVSGFVSGQPDLNDPYLAEVIRQYSQKGQAVQPPQTPQTEQRRGLQDSNWLQ